VYARLFNCTAASLPWRILRTYLESCANIVQVVVYYRPTSSPLAGNPLRDAVRSRNPSKSTLAHEAVATAVLHKHHLIIRIGTDLIQFVYWSHLRLTTEVTRNRNVFSPFFARVFWDNIGYMLSPENLQRFFPFIVSIRNALIVLWDALNLFLLCKQGQDVHVNHFFCMNVFLYCRSVSSPMQANYSWRVIRIQHVLRLSDCPTSLTSQIFNVAFVADGWRKYVVGYYLSCTCFCGTTWCLRQVAVLPTSPQILDLCPRISGPERNLKSLPIYSKPH